MTNKISLKFAGASTVGQTHIENGLPNQDALALIKKKKAIAIAVSDGMGSRPLSQIGSQTAVKCVSEALDLVDCTVDVESFIRLVCVLWRIRLKDTEISKYSCTCLFSVLFSNGRLIGGLLGDGVVYARIGQEEATLTGRNKEFANLTVPMDKCAVEDWQWFDKQARGGICLMLASDGIADDIENGKISSFYDSLYKNSVLSKGSKKKRNGCIKWILEHWTRPHSNDDKTLAVMKGKINV